ncbi:uncharacterized protein CELE_K08H2.7 [Caenorhabditis elegans]|uniref:Uncharacterized protein n=1 Tax=Caenorhabditis elegans TaxID=6239 RepID=A0A4V0IMB9_CAEEL|nr:Uncharacterized protein CELE_K08H2.7 [Caenorhabditis elegans]VTW47615.1 Uncharacterized protein CELE_K08H2.7 [Caenorhabditis elegans]
MAVLSNVDLLGSYIQYGIRTQEHSMLLGLNRENCSSKWNWWSRLENKTITAGVGNQSEPCDIVQGAFVVTRSLSCQWLKVLIQQHGSRFSQ